MQLSGRDYGFHPRLHKMKQNKMEQKGTSIVGADNLERWGEKSLAGLPDPRQGLRCEGSPGDIA